VQAEKERRREEAKELYERNVAAQPEHGASWLRWGLLEKERGAYDKARKLFKLGAMTGSGPEYVFHARAIMEMELGDTALAKQLVADGLAVSATGKAKSRANIGSLYEVRALVRIFCCCCCLVFE
jgi:tetratricopeptide (TPR) repeat protein